MIDVASVKLVQEIETSSSRLGLSIFPLHIFDQPDWYGFRCEWKALFHGRSIAFGKFRGFLRPPEILLDVRLSQGFVAN